MCSNDSISSKEMFRVRHLKFFFQLVFISWMVYPSAERRLNNTGKYFDITLKIMVMLQNGNHLFRWSSFWSWRVCKQAKLSHLGYRKPARMHWKSDAPKTSHCLVRILVQRHERIFIHKNWRGGYWQHLVSTGRRYVPHSQSYTWCFAGCFWRSHYQPQSSCRLAASELRFDIVGLLFVRCHQR